MVRIIFLLLTLLPVLRASASALYYDYRGNVTESREKTSFGTLRKTLTSYTYTGQPLKSTVTDNGMTVITENSYDAKSGLLTASDVTVNGVKQRVSAIEYDDLGRIASVTRGSGQKGGKVNYKYNLHGQTTEIKGPGFSQNLYYTDGPGKKLYNGSVSAMTWTMGSDTRVRGYKYTYNGYGWLTAAEYGENPDLWANQHRYTERSLEFMLNGGIRRLQRHGLKADGNYGKVDNLHIYYDGNRITGVLEDADPVTQNGSMDYPGGNKEMAFGYNEWGALVSDESRGIEDIEYDRFGNPLTIRYSKGHESSNVYSATGEKLMSLHMRNTSSIWTPIPLSLNPTAGLELMERVEYHGNVIYRDGKADMVLFPGGYATLDGEVLFHYYTHDYLGNVRAVISGSTGAIEQGLSYYPYGGIIPDLSKSIDHQPYKFGGKELITANGLNEYDFGARQYYPAVPGFTTPDKMAEKYSWLSPYLYCANNPVNAFDPDGNIIIFVNGMHFGDGGSSKYWNGIDKSAKSILNDNNALYIDGAFGGAVYTGLSIGTVFMGSDCSNLSASNRALLGYIRGKKEADRIYSNLEANETIKIITHSMGGAAAKGFVRALLQYAYKHNIDPRIIFELNLAPFEWWQQTGHKNVPNYTVSHWFDIVAGPSFMKNSNNVRNHTKASDFHPMDEHSVNSFKDDLKNVLEGIVKGMQSGDIKVTLDGRRIN